MLYIPVCAQVRESFKYKKIMKKTLLTAIFTMAVTPFAVADTTDILETSVAGISDMTSLTVDFGTSASSVSVQKDSDKGTITLSGTTFSPRNFSIALSLDYNTLVTLATANPGQGLVTASGSNKLGMGINTSNQFQGMWQDAFYEGLTTTTLDAMASSVVDGTLMVTLVSGDNVIGSSSGSRIYIGDDASQYYSKSGLQSTANYSSIIIDGAYANAVKGVYVFGSALSETDVLSVNSAIRTLSVPEPTSASLSLLALGALVLRRRR